MELKQLEYFVEFSKDLNFSKTAKRFFITPQGLSKAIHLLEDELQIPLITNLKGRIGLTTYGEYLAKRGTGIIGSIETLKKEIVHMYQLENNVISLNLSNSIRTIIYADVHNEFKELHPNISFIMHEHRDIECENKLLTGEVDVAISLGPLDPELFETYHLFDSPFTIMVHCSHRLANKSQIRFADLAGEKMVGMDENYKTYYLFSDAAKVHGVELQFVDNVDGALNSYYLCRGNHSYVGSLIGYLPKLFSDETMRYISFDMDEFCLNVYLVILKGRYRPYALSTYIDFIRHYDYNHYSKTVGLSGLMVKHGNLFYK